MTTDVATADAATVHAVTADVAATPLPLSRHAGYADRVSSDRDAE